MNLTTEDIIFVGSKINAFQRKYEDYQTMDYLDARSLLNLKELAEKQSNGDVAETCNRLLMKNYTPLLDKYDFEFVNLNQIVGRSVFSQHTNPVCIAALDKLLGEKKFMPSIAEVTECLDQVKSQQEKLFRSAHLVVESNKNNPSKEFPKESENLTNRMKRELPGIMGLETFTSWGHAMKDFRYFEKAETVMVICENSFYKSYLRQFSEAIIKASVALGLKTSSVNFFLPHEVSTTDPASPHFETSRFKKELYLVAEPLWTRKGIQAVTFLRIIGEKACAVVSNPYACNILIRFLEEKALNVSKKIHPSIQSFEFVAQGEEDSIKSFEEPTQKFIYGKSFTQKGYEDFLHMMEQMDLKQPLTQDLIQRVLIN